MTRSKANKPKKCPFCGAEPDLFHEYDTPRCGCSNEDCIAHFEDEGVDVALWNKRPIESKMRTRIRELEAHIAPHADGDMESTHYTLRGGHVMLHKVDLPDMQGERWTIEKFTVDRPDFGAILAGRNVPHGTYTRAMRGKKLVMSDTPAEMRDHHHAVYAATGSCLINGLGIGMVLKNILLKTDVTDVTVVEIDQELIDLVSPHYQDPRVTFVCSCSYTYKPPKGKKYDWVWHDIWDDICIDNLPLMHKLHRKYGRRAVWQGSWARGICEREKKALKSTRYYW